MKKVNCILCGGDENIIIDEHLEDKYYSQLNKKPPHSIKTVICKKCGFVYSNPQIEEKDKRDLYSKKYRPISAEEYYKKDYMKREIIRWKINWIKNFLKKIEEKTKLPKILDIGSAGGHLLYLFKLRGWETLGIEPTKEYAKYSIKKFKLKITRKFFEDAKLPNNFFDLVVLANVLEHFSDPNFALKKIHEKLKGGGLLFVIVPNILKPIGKVTDYFRSEHISYFSEKTLVAIAKKNGFGLLKINSKHYIRALFIKDEKIRKGEIKYNIENPSRIIRIIETYKKRYKVREYLRNILIKLKLIFLIKIYRKII